jgi:hypothetical protein
MTDSAYSISIRQNGEILRVFASLTRNVVQDYLQELISAGLPVKNIDFGNGFDITVTIPSAPHMFIKWIVEGGPRTRTADELERPQDQDPKP